MDSRPDDIARTEQDSPISYYPLTEEGDRLPNLRHVAVILDGNRRWAHEHGLPVIAGYQAGGRKVPALLGWCEGADIEVVTLWPLSADNLKRSPSEVQGLIEVIQEVVAALAEAGRWRIRLIGQVERLPASAVAAVRAAESMTAGIAGLTVNIALAYDGRAEITSAVRALLRERTPESIAVAGITEEDIAMRLTTHGQPDPDLIIRTSGEQRLSGFLPWQAVYSEIFFCPMHWPDFRKDDFDAALRWYSTRCRRFGR
jgi:short-chain Z-isoprenyl diphosphate synthase